MCHFCFQGSLETTHRKRQGGLCFHSISACNSLPCRHSSRIFPVDDVYECVDYLNALCTLTSPSRAAWGSRQNSNACLRTAVYFPFHHDQLFIFSDLTPYSEVLPAANSSSVDQEITHLARNPKAHYCCHKIPRTGPYLEPAESSAHLHVQFLTSLIPSSQSRLAFISDSLTKQQQRVFR
jgi:hypothetical protein